MVGERKSISGSINHDTYISASHKTDSYGNDRTNDPSGKYLISGLRQIIGGEKSETQLTLIRDVFSA